MASDKQSQDPRFATLRRKATDEFGRIVDIIPDRTILLLLEDLANAKGDNIVSGFWGCHLKYLTAEAPLHKDRDIRLQSFREWHQI